MTDDLVKAIEFEAVNSEIDRALAGRIIIALRAAEANNARLRADLKPLMRYVPHSVVECRGDKCREPWCASCCGADEAEAFISQARKEAEIARAALNTGKADT